MTRPRPENASAIIARDDDADGAIVPDDDIPSYTHAVLEELH